MSVSYSTHWNRTRQPLDVGHRGLGGSFGLGKYVHVLGLHIYDQEPSQYLLIETFIPPPSNAFFCLRNWDKLYL